MLSSEAPGTDVHSLTFTVDHEAHRVNVRLVHTGCVPLGVAHVPPEPGDLVTYFTLGQFRYL